MNDAYGKISTSALEIHNPQLPFSANLEGREFHRRALEQQSRDRAFERAVQATQCERYNPVADKLKEKLKARKPTPARQCERCVSPGRLKCSGCGGAFYCSAEHQKLDWMLHRETCDSVPADRRLAYQVARVTARLPTPRTGKYIPENLDEWSKCLLEDSQGKGQPVRWWTPRRHLHCQKL